MSWEKYPEVGCLNPIIRNIYFYEHDGKLPETNCNMINDILEVREVANMFWWLYVTKIMINPPKNKQYLNVSHSIDSSLDHQQLAASQKMNLKNSFSNDNINGLVQERRNSIANVLELRLSCTNPSTWINMINFQLNVILCVLISY